jgi:hypothetical protein
LNFLVCFLKKICLILNCSVKFNKYYCSFEFSTFCCLIFNFLMKKIDTESNYFFNFNTCKLKKNKLSVNFNKNIENSIHQYICWTLLKNLNFFLIFFNIRFRNFPDFIRYSCLINFHIPRKLTLNTYPYIYYIILIDLG